MKSLTLSICILLSISAFAQPGEQITVSAQQDSIVFTVNGETSDIAHKDMAAYYLSEGIAAAIEGDYTGAESKFKVGLLYDSKNAEILPREAGSFQKLNILILLYEKQSDRLYSSF